MYPYSGSVFCYNFISADIASNGAGCSNRFIIICFHLYLFLQAYQKAGSNTYLVIVICIMAKDKFEVSIDLMINKGGGNIGKLLLLTLYEQEKSNW